MDALQQVIFIAIEPKTKSDQQKLAQGLRKLMVEDPTFRINSDVQAGQTIVRGMDELQLEMIVDRLRREFNVEVTVGNPEVAYKETLTQMAEANPGDFIALRHAMKNYLGRDSGLAAVIRAVVEGSLVPVGYTNRFRGITGYLFRSEDLRKYRPVPGMTVHPEGVVTFGEAAAVLGVTMPVVRGLVAQGILHTTAEYRNGLSKLLPAVDVQRFAAAYVATSVLARRFHLHSGSLARHLKESGTPLLAIPIPDVGKYYAFFLHKDVAAQIQVPSRRMLREAAERRIVAARKRNWADYRQAKETALGKPMRRVGAKGLRTSV